MKVVVLISCMHQKDESIIYRTNIRTDVVVVNQCDREEIKKFKFKDSSGTEHDAIFISTKQRGLSRSRNMAIEAAPSDSICLLCDDDELLSDNYESIIQNEYIKNNASVIAFNIQRHDCEKKEILKKRNLGFIRLLKISSVQITFMRSSIVNANVKFDLMLGSGTGNGAGEENKFMLDCRRNRLKMIYIPVVIGRVMPGESNWFNGYNETYFINDGWSNRRIFGPIISLLYIIIYLITHKKNFKKISFFKALKLEIRGWRQKRK